MALNDRGSGETPPPNIIVVEPDVLIRLVIADYLRNCGYKVFEAVTADDVVSVLGNRQQVDIIFSAVELGGRMDGFGLAQWVRERRPEIDVILTSGIARTAAKAEDLCEDGPLEKPYHPQQVVRRINILLERRRTAPKT